MKLFKKHIITVVACICMLVFSTSPGLSQDQVADNMLLFQRAIGGWPKHYGGKNVDYSREYGTAEKAAILDEAHRNDATIDNGATTKEIRYLAKVFKTTGNSSYRDAAEKGVRYLLQAQYKNGGWPQFYPDKSGYRNEITFNDNAMINALQVLYDVANEREELAVVSNDLKKPAAKAVKKGIECILNTQIKVGGQLTAWCAQYDAVTLQPAKARTFELPSLSGSESVGIVEFLMEQPQPSAAIKTAVNAAVDWFNKVQITGYRFTEIPDATLPRGKDRVLVPEEGAVIWARFYDIETNEPFFCGRDGIKKKTLAEIEPERRSGYGWYGTWPKELLQKKYPAWRAAHG